MTSGVLPHLAASGSTTSGSRTNVAFVNPGPRSASLDAIVRRGDGTYLSSGRLGPIPANGIRQAELDSFIAMVRSRLDLSITLLLHESEEAPPG